MERPNVDTRKMRRWLAEWRVPAPAGHAERNKGTSFVFVDPARVREVEGELRRRLGDPYAEGTSHRAWRTAGPNVVLLLDDPPSVALQ